MFHLIPQNIVVVCNIISTDFQCSQFWLYCWSEGKYSAVSVVIIWNLKPIQFYYLDELLNSVSVSPFCQVVFEYTALLSWSESDSLCQNMEHELSETKFKNLTPTSHLQHINTTYEWVMNDKSATINQHYRQIYVLWVESLTCKKQ